MADAALARREARRRKILENSQNRLQRISGKANDDSCRESPVHTSTPDYQDINPSECSSKASLCNGVISSSIQTEECLVTTTEEIPTIQEEVINDLASLLPPKFPTANTDSLSKSSLIDNLVSYKYDIVLLSLFIQILYYFSLLTIESTYFFLPLVTYAGTKIYWFPKPANTNFENVLMLLKGLSTQRVQKLLSITQIVSAVGLDACIFVFTTICVQTLCIFLKQYFIT
ncbi:uncharacterized protein LOC119839967 [Zerene cesonia]|uniref:uncharacterized protein LOC119839967 n=1 Tax=Zerene cesonia TaxID=33412 RepID=UPI0018E4E0FA|nr:uncharacterized protein LOC119839967 [Zerene cesonia]